MTITVKELREAIKDLPDDTKVYYLTFREMDRDESHETADCPGIGYVDTDLYEDRGNSTPHVCVLVGENPNARSKTRTNASL